MSIWDRLGNVINSYLNDFGSDTYSYYKHSKDPDLDAAFEELNDFLNNKNHHYEKKRPENTNKERAHNRENLPPEDLRHDFEKLGVPFGADEETCKAAYKNLMKIHHPDRHAGHEGNFKKATERSARINASWDRIVKWRQEK